MYLPGVGDDRKDLIHLILSSGTRIVTRTEHSTIGGANGLIQKGAVGVIVNSPTDATQAYRVRFNDGTHAMLKRSEFSILKEFKNIIGRGNDSDQGNDAFEIWNTHVIYRCVVGSQAFGLNTQGSDVDKRGIFLPPADYHWSLYGVPEQIEKHETQETYWELQKFLVMALKANPNILECLYTPLVEEATLLTRELLSERRRFLSKLIYQTYNGYVMSQFKKLEQDLRARGEIKWKHAMHLMRLLLSGVTALREGELRIQLEEHRESLMAIKLGQKPWDVVNAWRLALHEQFDKAFIDTTLPERPDYQWANDFLIRARRTMV